MIPLDEPLQDISLLTTIPSKEPGGGGGGGGGGFPGDFEANVTVCLTNVTTRVHACQVGYVTDSQRKVLSTKVLSILTFISY